MNAHLAFLLSCLYEGGLHPPHLADLRKSGLSDETIARQKIRSVLPNLISQLLGFPGSKVMSALLFPFPCPTSRFMDHIRMKIFPALKTKKGSVKYLQPRHSGMRLYFPLATLDRALHRGEPLWLVEGEKKSLVAAQLGLPAVGFCGIEGWHPKGSQNLLGDFDRIGLRGRIVELVPDSDWQTNPDVERGVDRFAAALMARGARVRIVVLPASLDEAARG